MNTYNYKKIRDEKGFTLIELIVVITILGFLAMVAVPRVIGVVEKAKQNSSDANLSIIQNAVERYYVEVGKYPNDLSELIEGIKDEKDEIIYGPYLDVSPDVLDSYTISDGKVKKKTN